MKNKNNLYLFIVIALLLVGADVYAQEPTAKVSQQLIMSPKEFIFGTIQFLCMGLIVYFLMVINPTKTSEESHQQFMDNLKKNDDVITSSGIYGKVTSISPDGITIEIAPNTKVKFASKHILPLPKLESKAK